MALEDILETIRAESRQSAATVVAEAEARAEETRSAARHDAAQEEERLATSLDDRARVERRRRLSRARLEAAARRREAREHVYREAVSLVEERIAALRGSPQYREILTGLFDEAIAVLSDADAIHVDPGDADLVRAFLAERGADLALETEAMPLGGLRLTAARHAVDNTFASRIGRADGYLRDVAGATMPELRGVSA
jgi:V/A-type H+/Na+-transporting ATPase subunit E